MKIDYLIVGAGLTGCVIAERLSKNNSVMIVEKRGYIGGNCHDYYDDSGLLVHAHGPHFFHTSNKVVWDYLSQFTEWHYYQHRVLSYIEGEYHPFPPKYSHRLRERMYSGYSRKQWGSLYKELDPSIVRRVSPRLSEDKRYFNDKYQALPKHGFTKMMTRMVCQTPVSVLLNTKFEDVKDSIEYTNLIYTGKIDEFYSDRGLPKLMYKSLLFEFETYNQEFYLPAAQVNYPEDYDFTRQVEIKHATGQVHPHTTVVREYPLEDVFSGTPYYPIPCNTNKEVFSQYLNLMKLETSTHFVGRLAEFKYYNMDEAVFNALNFVGHIE